MQQQRSKRQFASDGEAQILPQTYGVANQNLSSPRVTSTIHEIACDIIEYIAERGKGLGGSPVAADYVAINCPNSPLGAKKFRNEEIFRISDVRAP